VAVDGASLALRIGGAACTAGRLRVEVIYEALVMDP
jgi:hypothetical protein